MRTNQIILLLLSCFGGVSIFLATHETMRTNQIVSFIYTVTVVVKYLVNRRLLDVFPFENDELFVGFELIVEEIVSPPFFVVLDGNKDDDADDVE